MFRIIFYLSLLIFLFSSQSSYSYEYKDGVYISAPPRETPASSLIIEQETENRSQNSSINQSRNELVKGYIKEFIIQNVLEVSQDLMRLALSTHNVQLFPQIASLAVQQISLECFKQDDTRKIIEDTFTEALTKANEGFDQEDNSATIKAEIDSIVRSKINPIVDTVIYKKIFESVFKQAQMQQQKVIVMQMAQRQAQFAMIQQNYDAIRQAVAKQYEYVVSEILKQKLELYIKEQR